MGTGGQPGFKSGKPSDEVSADELKNRLAVGMLLVQGLLPADGLAIVAFEAGEDEGGDDGQSAKRAKCQMNTVNHFRGNGRCGVRDEKCGGEPCCRYTEAD